MKIILAMVMSLDGKITKHHQTSIYNWTSEEDQKHFFSLISDNSLIIMGRNTFLASQKMMRLKPGKLRVVLTKNPKKYETFSVTDQLEFYNSSPVELIELLKKRKYERVLLVGGAITNSDFFKAKLINEVWITIEPQIFGQGHSLVGIEKLDVKLKLITIDKINARGTLLLKYKVLL